MPSCQKRTATPAEMLESGGRQGEGKGGKATKAGPEKDFVNHCDYGWDWFRFAGLREVQKMDIRGGHSWDGFRRCLNRRGLQLSRLSSCDAVLAAIICRD